MAADPFLPYARHTIDGEDIEAVNDVLRSDWLTTGPMVERFEDAVAAFSGVRHGVAVSSGTAALHCAMYAMDIKPADEVIVPAMTFAATANCIVYQGGTPVFVDVEPGALLMDPDRVEERITPRTRAIVCVDYAGHPCDYDRLRSLADRYHLILVADSCHSLGASYKGEKIGHLADMSVFSFHPVKHITTGEGGMAVTNHDHFATRMRLFRNHGITTDHRERAKKHTWRYDMVDLGYNYRLSDIQCALGRSQLRKLPQWLARRRAIAASYDQALADIPGIIPLRKEPWCDHAFHLYVVRVKRQEFGQDRDQLFSMLRAGNIGVNVHYQPVHLHPYYRRHFQTGPGLCPVSEEASREGLSLPMHHGMTDNDVRRVLDAVRQTDAEN